MREVFQRHLRPLDEKAYEVCECRISRIRHQPGIRYVVHYDLRLKETGTSREWTQGVAGVMRAEGRTQRLWEELRRSDQEPWILDATPTFAPVSYIPDLDMLVQVFPYDHRLPALSLLIGGPSPDLQSLLLPRFGTGDWRAEAWDIEVVRYLAETRATLRLTVQVQDAITGKAERRSFYAKVYRTGRKGEQTYRVLQALWGRAKAGGVHFEVGMPIAYLSDLRTLIQEEIPGTSLRDILLGEGEATQAVRRTAQALASLHLDRVNTPRCHRLWDEFSTLKARGNLLQRAYPHLRAEIKEIVAAVIAGLEEVTPAPTHCDLSLDHILLDGDRLGLVDLDAFAETDPILDVATVLSQFTIMALRSSLSRERAQTATRAFTEEYFSHVPDSWRGRLALRYANALLRRAVGLSENEIEALVKEAEDSLAGRIWWMEKLRTPD